MTSGLLWCAPFEYKSYHVEWRNRIGCFGVERMSSFLTYKRYISEGDTVIVCRVRDTMATMQHDLLILSTHTQERQDQLKILV